MDTVLFTDYDVLVFATASSAMALLLATTFNAAPALAGASAPDRSTVRA